MFSILTIVPCGAQAKEEREKLIQSIKEKDAVIKEKDMKLTKVDPLRLPA